MIGVFRRIVGHKFAIESEDGFAVGEFIDPCQASVGDQVKGDFASIGDIKALLVESSEPVRIWLEDALMNAEDVDKFFTTSE